MVLPLHISAGTIPYLRCFEIASERHRVPLPLLIGVARVESNFDPGARSSAGAHGIMQVRWPVTARHLGIRKVSELYNPCLNIDAGASYLRQLLDRFDTPAMALAAYNWGPTRLARGGRIPDSVRNYVEQVLASRPQTDVVNAKGVIRLNRFKSPYRAAEYVRALKRFAADAPVEIRQMSNYVDVMLDRGRLSDLDHARLTRLLNL
ncbi:MAG: lytic transglycosylase domain-containing protein [Gammaproteobacteria bacterium]|nr:lytic transglycosylase domain-containing protein [Gammaproteobacteria bacterium]